MINAFECTFVRRSIERWNERHFNHTFHFVRRDLSNGSKFELRSTLIYGRDENFGREVCIGDLKVIVTSEVAATYM